MKILPYWVASVVLSAGFIRPCAGPHDPFRYGAEMATLGAIVDCQGPTGRQPWSSAAFLDDTLVMGLSATGISYYGSDVCQGAGGLWYQSRLATIKASIAHLDAWQTWFEQTVIISIGTRILPVVNISAEETVYRLGCIGYTDRYLATAGFSLWIPWSWAGISLCAENLMCDKTVREELPPVIRFGIHSKRNRFGDLGALVSVTTEESRPVCFTIAQEYCVTSSLLFQAAISNNPLFIGVGVSFALSNSGLGVALVSHPILGWSQGFWAEWYR